MFYVLFMLMMPRIIFLAPAIESPQEVGVSVGEEKVGKAKAA